MSKSESLIDSNELILITKSFFGDLIYKIKFENRTTKGIIGLILV